MPHENHGAVKLPESTFCREIRSKKFYFLKSVPVEEHELLDGSNHCWCYRTMQVVGPDGSMVLPKTCRPGRTCYRSVFEASPVPDRTGSALETGE
ncbi:MAG: hypothetical protein KGJ62_02785 [Armatimonadetes bacterium]|nr:hypothetical protein [Armatimonadota bacterium]MDE2205629.1 hypothetical protein [Armatimonadota bacterium]